MTREVCQLQDDSFFIEITSSSKDKWYDEYVGNSFLVNRTKEYGYAVVDCKENFETIYKLNKDADIEAIKHRLSGEGHVYFAILSDHAEEIEPIVPDRSQLLEKCEHDLYLITCNKCWKES